MSDLLQEATRYAVAKHEGQTRKASGIPYVTHVFEVMKRVSNYLTPETKSRVKSSREDMLIAALLHDVIEDCRVDREEIRSCFNENVAVMVEQVTFSGGGFWKKYQWLNDLAYTENAFDALVIKIADRYCNVQDFVNTPGKEVYAAAYALQAAPLFRAYSELGWNYRILNDIQEMCELVNNTLYVHPITDSTRKIEASIKARL